MDSCIFCKIVKGEVPAEIIYEDDLVLAFLDINPVNYGHVLIIPKEHYPWFYDVPDNILNHLMIKSKKLVVAIKEALKSDYVALSVVGLDVPHFHLHLIPRWTDDGLSTFWPTKKYKEGQEKEYAKKIKMSLD